MMHPFPAPHQPLKFVTLLILLVAGLLLNSFAGQDSCDNLQRDAKAMYEDRLMPSVFLFDLREHLYQERALLQATPAAADRPQRLAAHRAAIGQLITQYEQTSLTREEAREWAAFKECLGRFHAAQGSGFRAHYEASVASLSRLNAIQASAGKRLEARVMATTRAFSVRSYLEMALIIAVAVITIRLLGHSKTVLEETAPQTPSLN